MFPKEIFEIISSFCNPKEQHILNNILRIKGKYIWEYKKHLNIEDKPKGLLMIKNKENIRVRDIKPDILIWRNPIVGIGYTSIKYLNLNLFNNTQNYIYLSDFPLLKVGIFQHGLILIANYPHLNIESLYFHNVLIENTYNQLNVEELRFSNCHMSANLGLKIYAKRFYSKNTILPPKISYQEFSKKSEYYTSDGYSTIKMKHKYKKLQTFTNKKGKEYNQFYIKNYHKIKNYRFII